MRPPLVLLGALLLLPSALFTQTASAPAPHAVERPAGPDLAARARAALAPTSGTLRVAGLEQPVTVLRDPWGIPHIYAATQADLFFAQGFTAAEDRLWQLEMWRRSAMGELSEVMGPAALDRDRFARLLRYRGDLDAEYASYAPDAREIVAAFVRGVNAWIAEIGSDRSRWPIELQLTGIAPEPWTLEVVLSRLAAWEVTANAGREVQRAQLGAEIGWQRLQDLMPADPPRDLAEEPGADLASGISEAVTALFESLRAPLAFPDGSNNWVVDGTLSATGKPLLANDPHRALRLPSLRYLVHLVGPGWNVIGAGEPALPGVAAGHNERIAFGFTVTGIDQQDVYVEEVHPEDPSLYRHQGRWEKIRVERERIAVKCEAPREVELEFTVHGPVLHRDRERRRAYVLRWVGSEPGTAGYLASLSLNRAWDWSTFRQVAGLAPVRRGWSGLLPVPGDGRFEWQGFLPAAELPGALDPPAHWIATANHNVLPPGYPHALAFDWGEPTRFRRIAEVLGAPGRKFTAADFERLQLDEQSRPAREILAVLREVKGAGADLQPFVGLLTAWDGTLDRNSAAAALYELWIAKLAGRLAAPVPEKLQPVLLRTLRPARLVALLRQPSRDWFGDDPRAGRDAALLASLGEAVAEAKEKLGADPAAWRWGALHQATFAHPLATTLERKALFDLPPMELGGDGTTVDVASGEGFAVNHGASYRQVIDLADWDRSTATSTPGQSGQPGSPHYGDLLEPWAEGRYFPLLFSREAVEKAARQKLVLEPGEPQPAAGRPGS